MRQFSCPETGFDETVADAILIAHGTAVLDAFCTRYAAALTAAADGLDGALGDWLRAGLTRRDVLALPMGEAAKALTEPHPAPVRLAVDLALEAAATGLPARWSARLEEPATRRFGPWRHPPARDVALAADGDRVTLAAGPDDTAGPIVFERTDDAWQCRDPRVERAPCLGTVELYGRGDVSPHIRELADFRNCRPVERVTPDAAALVAEAVDLLDRAGPVWRQWFDRAVRRVLLLHAGDGTRSMSGSSSETPGLIALSLAPPLRVAEMLVHESSHLYYHIAGLVGPVEDGSDRRLYFSPAVQRERPLDRILVAFHAFGNVLVFYRALRRAGADPDGWLEQSITRLSGEVSALEAPLRDNPALTEVGRALVAPLRDHLEGTACA
jgi:HEXXH motif-containing protein